MRLLGKAAFYILYPLVVLYVRVFQVPRTRVILVSKQGNVLLVKTWFGRQRWGLPGGGVGRGEELAAAASREVREETGLDVAPEQLHFIGRVALNEGAPMRYELFRAVELDEALPPLSWMRKLEIIERAWTSPGELPIEMKHTIIRNI